MVIKLVISGVIAVVPIGAWLFLLLKDYRNKKTAFLMFFGGVLAVFFMWLVQVLGDFVANHALNDLTGGLVSGAAFDFLDGIWGFLQAYNPVALIKGKATALLVVLVISGALEEIFKQWLVRFADNQALLIKDINSSVRYSLLAALGFAFAENIYYFYGIWSSLGAEFLLAPVVFRSTFTAAAHMCFSGLWGYYYGQGKFCVNIVAKNKWQHRKMWIARLWARLTGMPLTQAFREQMIFRGLFLAMFLHAIFNWLLEMGYVLVVMVFIGLAFGYLMYLLTKKSGNLVLVNDVDTRELSTMATRDEEAVVEYIGVIYGEGKYSQVVETCERLLEKNPGNNVVKLFQAKAYDKLKLQSYIESLIQKKTENKM